MNKRKFALISMAACCLLAVSALVGCAESRCCKSDGKDCKTSDKCCPNGKCAHCGKPCAECCKDGKCKCMEGKEAPKGA